MKKNTLAVLLAMLLSASGAWAGTFTWTGATSGNWTVGTNWAGGSAPANDGSSNVFFPDGASNLSISNIPSDFVNSITFSGSLGGYTLAIGGGNTLETNVIAGLTSSATSGTNLITGGTFMMFSTDSVIATLAGGTLNITSAFTMGGTVLYVQNDGPCNISGVIANQVYQLNKSGAGTLTLSAANLFNNGVFINAGTLLLDFSAAGAPASNIISSGNPLTLAGGGTLLVKGNPSGTTAQTLGNVTVNAGGGQILCNPNGGTSTTLNLGTIPYVTAGTPGTVGSTLLLGSAPSPGAGVTIVTTTSNNLNNGIYSPRIVYTPDGVNFDWATTLSGSSPYTISSYTAYTTFTGSGGGLNTNFLYAPNGGGSITLSSSITAYTFKIGTGVTITCGGDNISLGANSGTNVTGGLLSVGTSASSITGTGQLKLQTAGNDLVIHQFNSGGLTVSCQLLTGNDTGSVTKGGTGTVTVSASSSFQGAVAINAGVVLCTNTSGLGSASSTHNIVVASNAQLQLSGTNSYGGNVYDLQLSGNGPDGTGALRNISGTGTWSNAAITLNANATIEADSGTELVIQGNSSPNLVPGNYLATFNALGPAGTANFNSQGLNTNGLGGTIIKTGPGVMLMGSSLTTQLTAILIKNGTLKQQNNSNWLGSNSQNLAITMGDSSNPGNASTLDLNGTTPVVGTSSGVFTISSAYGVPAANMIVDNSSSSAVTLTVTGTCTYGGVIQDSGNATSLALKFNGSGNTMTLSGPNTFGGAVNVTAGNLNIQSNQGLGSTSNSHNVSVASGAQLQLQGNISVTSKAPLSTLNGSLVNVSGNNTFPNAITIANANQGITSDAGTLSLTSGTALGGNFALTISGPGNVDLTGGYSCSSSILTISMGTGTFICGGSYTATDSIAVTSGTALFNGNNAGVIAGTTGEVQVSSGATLGGTGILSTGNSQVVVNAGGFIAPGGTDGTGVLTMPELILNGTAIFNLTGAATGTEAKTTFGGSVAGITFGGSSAVVVHNAGGFTTSTTYTLFTEAFGDSISGTAATLTLPAGFTSSLVYTPGTGVTLSPSATGTTCTWLGGTSVNWSNTNNWTRSPANVPQSGDLVVIPSGTTFAPTVDVATNVIGSLSITGTSPVTLTVGLGGTGTLNVGTGGIATTTAQPHQIAGASGGTLVLNTSDQTWDIFPGGSLAVAAPISGAYNLIKTDTGTLTLSGANSYVNTSIINGTVVASTSTTPLGTGTVYLGDNTLANTVLLQAANGTTVPNTILVQNGTPTLGSAADSTSTTFSGSVNFSNALTIASGATGSNVLTFSNTSLGVYSPTGSALTVSSGNVTVAGPINGSGAALNMNSTGGTLTLSGANNFTGNTSVNDGMLLVNGSLAAASTTSVGNGATLAGTGVVSPILCNGTGTLSSLAGVVWPGKTFKASNGPCPTFSHTGGEQLTCTTANFATSGTRYGRLETIVTLDSASAVVGQKLVASGTVTLGSLSTLSVSVYPQSSYNISVTLLNAGGTNIANSFGTIVFGGTTISSFPYTGGGGTIDIVYETTEGTPLYHQNNFLSGAALTTACQYVQVVLSGAVTPVTLDSFTARTEGAGVRLDWHAASEFENLGFNVLRRDVGVDTSSAGGIAWQRVNPVLIPGRLTNADAKTYHLYDWSASAGAYEYKLESVTLTGGKETFGQTAQALAASVPAGISAAGFDAAVAAVTPSGTGAQRER